MCRHIEAGLPKRLIHPWSGQTPYLESPNKGLFPTILIGLLPQGTLQPNKRFDRIVNPQQAGLLEGGESLFGEGNTFIEEMKPSSKRPGRQRHPTRRTP